MTNSSMLSTSTSVKVIPTVFRDEKNYYDILKLFTCDIDKTASMKNFLSKMVPSSTSLVAAKVDFSQWTCHLCTYIHLTESEQR